MDGALQEVDDLLIQLSKDRLNEMGDIESGLFNYYITRIGHGTMFNEDDLRMIEYIQENEDSSCKILEVAAGCGQVSFGLEAIGFNQVEFSEFDSRRLSYGEYLKKNLESKVEIYGCDYRDLELGKYDLIFVVNAVASSIGAQDSEKLISVIENGTDVILKYGYYGVENGIFEILGKTDTVNQEVIFSTNEEFRRFSRVSS